MHKVILLHGFNKNKSDMEVLKSNLLLHNLECILIDLPLTFKKIEYSASIFEGIFENIIRDINDEEKISLVGHSSGGLVIRKFLSDTKHLKRVHKCILIATPNHGSKLADFACKVSKTYVKIFKTLGSLQTENINNLQLQKTVIDIGAIAGNYNNLLLGKLLQNENDGRVEVHSVFYDELKDFIVVPYGHKEIHYKFETANLINNFIKYSEFIIREDI